VLAGGVGFRIWGRPLDAIVENLELDHADLIKTNIEGGERLAIRGMESLIERTRHVAIACHDSVAGEAELDAPDVEQFRTKALVERFLREHGFETTTDPTASEPWVRDYVYGVRVDD